MDDERNSICSNIFSAIQDNMKKLYAPEIFSKSSFEELGAFYYGALIDTVEGATTELINAVVATLKKNSKFEEQEEYYKNLCYILGFKLLPKEAYDWVQNKYDDLFVVRWNSIIQKYEVCTKVTEWIKAYIQDQKSKGSYSEGKFQSFLITTLRDYMNGDSDLLKARQEIMEVIAGKLGITLEKLKSGEWN